MVLMHHKCRLQNTSRRYVTRQIMAQQKSPKAGCRNANSNLTLVCATGPLLFMNMYHFLN